MPARNVRRSITESSRSQSASQARGDAERGQPGRVHAGVLLIGWAGCSRAEQ